MKEKYMYYKNHEKRDKVWVIKNNLGVDDIYCLCHNCKRFKPLDKDNNCYIANAVHSLNVLANVTTPVWECPTFEERE